MDLIAQGKHEPRNPVNLEPTLQEGFSCLPDQWSTGGIGADFTYMINTMTGNAVTTPPFGLGLDPTATMTGTDPVQQQQQQQHQQHGNLGHFPMWGNVPHDPNDMASIDTISGIYQ